MRREFWAGRNVLVTGAGGFKGSHLVEELAKADANVVSLVRDFDPKSYFETEKLGDRSTVVVGDLKDPVKMADMLSKYNINSIFHLGAQPLVTTALRNPRETLESNIMGTVNVLEAARLYSDASEILVVSSDKAYGPCDRLPYDENERLQGRAPYDVSKSCADLIAQMYAHVFGMPVTISRCANVFGPGDLNFGRLIPGLMEALIKGKALDIRSNGKMLREYIYVKDSIGGYITLAENIDKTKGEAFNIAGKGVFSVTEVIDKVVMYLGKGVDTNILNKAKAEIGAQCLDGSKIKNLLGWEPKTSFEDAIKETYCWYGRVLQ